MKVKQSNYQFGNVRWILLAALAGLILVGTIIAIQSMPGKAVRKKQADLLVGLEKRSSARIQSLLSEEYSDRWKFTKPDAVEAMVDVGSQFMVLVVKGEEVDFKQEGDIVKVSADLTVSGKPVGPGGQAVVRRVNRLETPFVFSWKKEGFLPTSWRLVSIDNESLPAELYGYEPGDIRRAMQGE